MDSVSDAAVGRAFRMEGSSCDLVLLVEDDDTIAGLITQILARGSHRVVRARNGAECLRMFAENSAAIALVILDGRLPDADGASLCCRLREGCPEVPVLLTSGRAFSRDALAASRATAFLPKPFRPVEMQERVSALLGTRS